jgi:HSP20 family molecular chaperone IbpA
MLKEKKSFFERLAGSISVDDEDELDFIPEEEEEEVPIKHVGKKADVPMPKPRTHVAHIQEDEDEDIGMEEGELSVDVYQTPNEIIIEAMVAGVKPEDLHLSITRDMVTIKGRRDGNTQVTHDDYFYKELYWGSFTRTILLPHEVEIEEAEAVEKHGLLIIRLPKLDKARQAKLKVKSI